MGRNGPLHPEEQERSWLSVTLEGLFYLTAILLLCWGFGIAAGENARQADRDWAAIRHQ